MKRVVLLCLALTICVTAPASATVYEVNTTADTTVAGGCDTDPTCSIRDALNIADNSADNTVQLPAGRYELNTPTVVGALQLGATTNVIGAGARSTIIDANGESRVFNVFGTNRIEGVTITGGAATFFEIMGFPLDFGDGGGILTQGNFTLVNSTVTGNTAQFSGGGVATGTFFEGPDPGPVTIIGSTISDNTVTGGAGQGQGGGVTAFSDLTMTNTTVTGNSAENVGVSNQGGGVLATDGATRLNNVTIANNTATGVADLGAGFAGDNIGLPPAASQLTATNTIIAGNTFNGTASDCGLVNTVASDNNLSSDDSCDFDDAGSKEDTNPQLGALGNNGGLTDTLKFAQGAPPYNAGVANGCQTTDQRGVGRVQQGTCDIGAVELAPPTAVTGATSGLTSTSATLLGTSTNPLVTAANSAFEFGTTTGYGQTAGASGVAAGATEGESGPVSGLAPETLYHYRLVVFNGDGISRGADRTFITPAAASQEARRRPTVASAGVPRGCVRRAFTLRVRARVASGTRLKAVRVTLDGRTLRRTTRSRFTVRVNAQRLSSGRHTLRIKAVDRGNRTRTVTRRFSRCARVPVADPRFTG